MKVPEQFIASLLSRVDLVEIISKKVDLRRVGSNFVGLCPFHQEKTPSFTVNKEKQFFHCFGCKKSGDAINFVMELEHKTFLDAVEILANSYGLHLEKEPQQELNPIIEEIYKILNLAADFYHQELLKNSDTAKVALNYLLKRGINKSTIENFKLGFVDSGWTNLYDFCVKQSLEPSLLQQAGLILEKNSKFYDRFRSRIMFPIRNKFGKTIGFGARALYEEQIPKYLNSPETIVFKKNQELYGLDVVKNKLKNINNLIVVEGYFDVLSLAQSGISNVVATLGTALNENHLKIIFNVTSEIIFCFDGDEAGYKATVRAMELCMKMMALGNMKNNHTVKFVLLPNNYDPDLLIKKQGPQEFKHLLQDAKILSDFFFECLSKKYSANNIEGLHQLAETASLQISKFQDDLLKDLWYEKLAGLLGVNSSILKTIKPKTYNNSYNNTNKINSTIKKAKINYSYPDLIAYRALAMLVKEQSLLRLCDSLNFVKFSKFKLSVDLELFVKVVEVMKSLLPKEVKIEELVANLDPVYAQKLLSIEIKKIVQFIPKEGMEQEFLGAVKKINKRLVEQMVDELLIIAKDRHLEDQEKLLLQQMLKEL